MRFIELVKIITNINYTHLITTIIGLSICFLLINSSNSQLADEVNESHPNIFSIHEMELREGVSGEELEAFFNERFFPNWDIQGWNSFLIKGDRGDREGLYALIHEIESVEIRNRYFPAPGQATDLWESHTEAFENIYAELDDLVSVYPGEAYTDYVLVGN